MAHEENVDVVLYDLACNQNVCFSPTVWRTRLLLNYKNISYRTVFVELVDVASKIRELGVAPNLDAKRPYTVPTIHHIPSDTFVMESSKIAEFLHSKYPEPGFILTSELGSKIEQEARKATGGMLVKTITPREAHIFSPRSEEFFSKSREEEFGRPLEDLLVSQEQETQLWEAAHEKMLACGELIQTNKAKGPFILGDTPSGADFWLTGALESMRIIHEPAFKKVTSYAGYRDVYEACAPWMKKDT